MSRILSLVPEVSTALDVGIVLEVVVLSDTVADSVADTELLIVAVVARFLPDEDEQVPPYAQSVSNAQTVVGSWPNRIAGTYSANEQNVLEDTQLLLSAHLAIEISQPSLVCSVLRPLQLFLHQPNPIYGSLPPPQPQPEGWGEGSI